jgi:hypothetical protein
VEDCAGVVRVVSGDAPEAAGTDSGAMCSACAAVCSHRPLSCGTGLHCAVV